MKLEFLIALLLIIEFMGFYYFYSSNDGIKSVYKAWYDWMIDLMAASSGFYIMGFAAFLHLNTDFNKWFLFFLFLVGSWQGLMHVAKWLVRRRIS